MLVVGASHSLHKLMTVTLGSVDNVKSRDRVSNQADQAKGKRSEAGGTKKTRTEDTDGDEGQGPTMDTASLLQ